ncbi:hypothetical protein O1611_g9372 [Lasiodiplodia mahajangana]|uniref:Uncharacterized protein n=1 Tax=Lasiodiplodia mahajangana TaxID=1108764 RepID=A0ACC2JA80_9PEZI|nr:hypothetical protein O1611_g9372 [Lasiodiplodia mahajangana]
MAGIGASPVAHWRRQHQHPWSVPGIPQEPRASGLNSLEDQEQSINSSPLLGPVGVGPALFSYTARDFQRGSGVISSELSAVGLDDGFGYVSRPQRSICPTSLIIVVSLSAAYHPTKDGCQIWTVRYMAEDASRHKYKASSTDVSGDNSGGGVCVGGPAFVMWIQPTDEELFKRYNPELQKRSLEGRYERQKEFDDFVTRLKEYSKSDKPIWTVQEEAIRQHKQESLRQDFQNAEEAKTRQKAMRRETGLLESAGEPNTLTLLAIVTPTNKPHPLTNLTAQQPKRNLRPMTHHLAIKDIPAKKPSLLQALLLLLIEPLKHDLIKRDLIPAIRRHDKPVLNNAERKPVRAKRNMAAVLVRMIKQIGDGLQRQMIIPRSAAPSLQRRIEVVESPRVDEQPGISVRVLAILPFR